MKIQLFSISFKRGVYFIVLALGSIRSIVNDINDGIISIQILSVSGLNSQYTDKYSHFPLKISRGFTLGNSLCKGLYLTGYPLSCPNTDTGWAFFDSGQIHTFYKRAVTFEPLMGF